LSEGHINDGFAAFDQALQADPKNSSVFAEFGRGLFELAQKATDPADTNRVQISAEAVLLDALELDWNEKLAKQVLQLISSNLYVSEARSRPELIELLRLGDHHFAANRLDEAKDYYRQVLSLDPNNWTAVKFLGNCHYVRGEMDQAEPLFRQATELNPLDPQAHRFLCDTYFEQKNYRAMWASAFSMVAAHPRYWSGWMVLDELQRPLGPEAELRRFRLRPAARFSVDPDGSRTIHVRPDAPSHVAAAWMVHAVALASAPSQAATPFQRELHALTAMATHIREVLAAKPDERFPTELALLPLFAEHNDLDAALFTLCFREEFRPDFEAWKRADDWSQRQPFQRVESFLSRARLRPL
jgi:tetratricopeptide (TPR) repeat protein